VAARKGASARPELGGVANGVPSRWHPRQTPSAGGRPSLRRRQRATPAPTPGVAATSGEPSLALRHDWCNGRRHAHRRKRACHLWRERLPWDAPCCTRRPHAMIRRSWTPRPLRTRSAPREFDTCWKKLDEQRALARRPPINKHVGVTVVLDTEALSRRASGRG